MRGYFSLNAYHATFSASHYPLTTIFSPFTTKYESCHLGLEMHFSATAQNGVAHILNNTRQLIRSDMGMSISQDIGRSSMLTEHSENLFDRSPFLTASIKFAVGIGSRPTLAEAIIAFWVYLLCLANLRQVELALTHILTTFQHYWAQTEFNETQGSKESARPCSHHNDLWTLADIRIVHKLIHIILRLFIDIHTYLQIDEDSTLTGIDAPTQDTYSRNRAHIKAILISQPLAQVLFDCRHMRPYTNLILLHHI